ncbi:MAG: hypothetical protein HZA61_03620 [Candidatus Eisenbacteria bacterium]|uniref:Uncharacterized protein n=1 Tax=Eiseniibacteriota bacterium TaxID=2212470 RepID=A0A933S9Q6_UNCEI|nr:hypothetical protein [Candidatus Eisenbacteria bacterium]
MRRLLAPLVLLLCVSNAPAHAAQGMNLSWDNCFGDGAVRNKTFACDTNTGSEQLYVSFELDSAFAPLTGLELSMVIATPAGPSSAWWQFKNTGSCRQTALSASAIPLVPGVSCVDYWQGAAAGGVTAYILNYNYAGSNRLLAVFALPMSAAASLDAGTEYFGIRIAITHAKTVGTGSCPGCLDPVCLGLENLLLTRPAGVGDLRLAEETTFGSSTVNWQGAAAGSVRVKRDNPYYPNWFYRVLSCASATPARNHTWGSIKSQYH